jgi:drug/metabolite transporter (DMT)-like permease
MSGMALTVSLTRFVSNPSIDALKSPMAGLVFIIILGLTTAISRLSMFYSLEILGGAQTAILTLTELTVSLTFAFIILGDRLYWHQWIGAVLLLGGGILARKATDQ